MMKIIVLWFKFDLNLFVIDNKPALVQIMAWRRIGDKLLSGRRVVEPTDAYMRHVATMALM